VLQYLKDDPSLGLALEIGDSKNIAIESCVDAAYGNHADGKGHTGMSIAIGKGAGKAKSTKQKLVSNSSTESELIGMSDSCSQIIWTRDFLTNQGYNMGPR
jgi:hypothetical protein